METEMKNLINWPKLAEKHVLVRLLLAMAGEDIGKEEQKRVRQKLEKERPRLRWWVNSGN